MNNDKSPNWNLFGDDESEDKSPIKKQPDFFSGFLASRLASHEQTKENQEELDDDEEDDEENPKTAKSKPKRSPRGFLDEIFPRFTEDPKSGGVGQASAEVRGPVVADPSEVISPIAATSVSAEAAPLAEKSNPNATQEGSGDLAEAASNEAESSEERAEKDVSDPTELKIPHESTKERDEVAEDVHSSDSQMGRATVFVPPVPPPLRTPSAASESNFSTRLPSRETPVTERIVEKKSEGSGAVFAFLGAEFLSRRRDRKLKREIKTLHNKTSEDIRNLRSEQLSQQQAQARLEQHQNKQAEQLVQLEQSGKQTEQSLTAGNLVVGAETRVPERDMPERPIRAAENTAPRIIQQEAIAEPAGIMSVPEKNMTEFQRPEMHVPTVEQPANRGLQDKKEQYRPADKHETLAKEAKTAQSRDRSMSNGYGTGDYGAERELSQPERSQPQTSSNHGGTGLNTQAPPIYKQSVQAGIGFALLILLVALIAYVAS